jgi:hypothetical protein
MHDRVLLSAAILAQWQHPVASSEAVDLLHWLMCAVSYPRTTTAIKTASKVGAFCHRCFVCCHPGGRRGDTEQVAAPWQCPVASSKALDIVQWAMCTVLHPCLRMAIKMVHNGGIFNHHCHLFCMMIRSYKTMLWSIKTNPTCNINPVGLISLLVCYWPPPATINTVLATIVAGG